jgi:hypothetical protein
MGESGANEESKKTSNQVTENKNSPIDANKSKNKKPKIKKNKLDLRKKQKAKESFKKGLTESLTSSAVNKFDIFNSKVNQIGESKTNQIWPNKITFENFLNHYSIRFLKKDMIFLLKDLGAVDDCLYQDRFTRFLFSNVWEP